MSLYRSSLISCVGLALFFGFGCIKQSETGKSAFIMTTVGQENQLGEDGYKEVLAKAEVSKDQRLNAILQRVGKRISAQAKQPDYKWEFTLIESEEQNAWCMPGGKVAFYTGILPPLQTEGGMAAVMGHEVAHAVLRHAGQRITQTMVVNMGLSVADVSLSNAKQKNTIMGLMGLGAEVGVLLPYSRSHESESDAIGLKYMAKAGYDPREAVRFWQRFQKSAGAVPPEFLSTHPASSRRINDLNAQMTEATKLYMASKNKYGTGEVLMKK